MLDLNTVRVYCQCLADSRLKNSCENEWCKEAARLVGKLVSHDVLRKKARAFVSKYGVSLKTPAIPSLTKVQWCRVIRIIKQKISHPILLAWISVGKKTYKSEWDLELIAHFGSHQAGVSARCSYPVKCRRSREPRLGGIIIPLYQLRQAHYFAG